MVLIQPNMEWSLTGLAMVFALLRYLCTFGLQKNRFSSKAFGHTSFKKKLVERLSFSARKYNLFHTTAIFKKQTNRTRSGCRGNRNGRGNRFDPEDHVSLHQLHPSNPPATKHGHCRTSPFLALPTQSNWKFKALYSQNRESHT